VSFGPNLLINHSVLHDIMAKYSSLDKHNYVDRLCTSGNVLKLDLWKSFGGFREELFIDEVDHEFCYRLKENGYNIILISNCLLNHSIGGNKKYILPHIASNHRNERIYYKIRNIFFIKNNHYLFYKKYKYQLIIARTFIEKILALDFYDIKFVIKGIKDAQSNKYGMYE
jgi:rhamnosyltransferase